MLKNFLYNFGGRVGVLLIGAARTFIIPNFLGPAFYGVLSLFGMFRTFLGFLNFGIGSAYFHHMTDIRSKAPTKETLKTENGKYFNAQVAVNSVGIPLAILAAIALYPRYSDQSLVYIAGIISIFFSHALVVSYMLARQQVFLEKHFKFMSLVTLGESLTGAVGAILGAILFSLVGVLALQPLEFLVGCILYTKAVGGLPKIQIDWVQCREVLRSSIRYFYGNVAFVILRMADRILIAGMLTMESLGYYALAHTLSEHVKMFIASLHEVITPGIAERISKIENLKDIAVEMEHQTRLLFGVILYLNANAFIFSGLFYYVLPKFGNSVEIFRILIISLSVALFALYPSLLINSKRVGKASVLSTFTVASSLINAGLSYALILNGYGIMGVAVGTLVSNIIMTVLCYLYIHRYVLEKSLSFSYFGWILCPPAIFGVLYIFRDKPVWMLWLFFHAIFLALYARDLKDCLQMVKSLLNMKTYGDISANQ